MKNQGVTSSEEYLYNLARGSFLSLWSYTNLYRDQWEARKGGDGKEVCDLLVVFGKHVIIFSDKHCEFSTHQDLKIAWKRWYKRTILDSAKQVWGAERWIKEHPSRVFTDSKCRTRLPINIPLPEEMIIHRIVVAHGAGAYCEEYYGGSGSLMLIYGEETPGFPFSVGRIDLKKGIVHVLDDVSLEIIMKKLDTISDFIAYLSKKEELILRMNNVHSASEEDLLAMYLKNINQDGVHDFVISKDFNSIYVDEGLWDEYKSNPQRIRQIEADRISYIWDGLIEQFNKHIIDQDQYFTNSQSISESEPAVRFLASANRLKRRMLGEAFYGLLIKSSNRQIMRRFLPPIAEGDPYYVFIAMSNSFEKTREEYREFRRLYLEACCKVVKSKYKNINDIIGIATEPGLNGEFRSEDLVYLDGRLWDEEMQSEAEKLADDLGILKNPKSFYSHHSEYPKNDINTPKGRDRNKPCMCGSGKKYKHCHGKNV